MDNLQRIGRFAQAGILVVTLTLCLVWQAKSEDSSIEKAIKTFGANDVQGYVQPLADIFGANMGAGWYRSAEIPRSGFNISFNIVGMGSVISDEQKTYLANSPAGYAQKTFETATIFGKDGGKVTDPPSGLSYKGTGGAINTAMFPLAALQVNLGSLYGTQFILRGLPIPSVSGVPKITYVGAGVRHNVSQYLFAGDEPPVHVAFSGYYSRIAFGDIITLNNFGVGPQISKRFAIIELYGGLAYESSSMKLSYTPSISYTDPLTSTANSIPVDISLDGANTFRGTVGVQLNLAVLHLHLDANFGSVTNFSSGIGFGF